MIRYSYPSLENIGIKSDFGFDTEAAERRLCGKTHV